MTTNVVVHPHSHDVLVETWDRQYDAETRGLGDFKKTSDRVVKIGEGETFYSTTTREIRVVDLEMNDPRLHA